MIKQNSIIGKRKEGGKRKSKVNRKRYDKEVFLIDGLNLLFRSDFNTGIYRGVKRISGIINFLYKIRKIKKDNPGVKVIVCWDGGRGNRNEIFAGYKDRPHTEQRYDIIKQAIELEKILEWFGIHSIRIKPWEADDIIATLASKLKSEHKVTIYSTDKDLLQLIDKNVDVYNYKKTVTINNIEKLYGYSGDELVLQKVVMGDKSDTIPGIYGIGPKRFDTIFASVGKNVDAFLQLSSIQRHIDIIERNYKLMKLDPVDIDVSSVDKVLGLDRENIKQYLYELRSTRILAGFGNFMEPFEG